MTAFDLDRFAPPPVRFKLHNVEYRVDGDPDVDTVARMLRIEADLEGEKAMEAAAEGRDLILAMVREHDPSVDELKVSPREILTVFYLIMRGPSVAAAVAQAITDPTLTSGDTTEPAERPAHAAEGDDDEEGADGPLASAASSFGRSSRSASATDSPADLVTGSAI